MRAIDRAHERGKERADVKGIGRVDEREREGATCLAGQGGWLTCEELKNEHAAAHLLEHGVPDLAAALKAALTDIQDVVAPHDPAEDKVDEGKGQNDGAGGSISEGDDVDEHHDANFPPIPDAVGPQGSHLVPVGLGGA